MRVGIKCPVDGARISDATCLACYSGSPRAASGQRCDFVYEQLRAMMDDGGREDAAISATMLGGICERQTWLKGRHDWYLNPNHGYHAFRGTFAHLVLEQYPESGAIYEQRFRVIINGQEVTGKIDKVHLARKHVVDGKSKAEDKEAPTRADADYVKQLNVYKYLLWHGSPIYPILVDGVDQALERPFWPGEPARIEVERLELCYWTFGWSRIIPVPILPEAEILRYIESGAYAQSQAVAPPIPQGLDPVGKRGQPSTFCQIWCPVREACLGHLLSEDTDGF